MQVLLPHLNNNQTVIFDLETRDDGIALNRGSSWSGATEGEVIGFGVGWDGGEIYLPIAHSEGNLPRDEVLAWIKNLFSTPREVVGHNLMYDIGWLFACGITPHPETVFRDTMFAEQVLCAVQRPKGSDMFRVSLDAVAKRRGCPLKNTDGLVVEAVRLKKLSSKEANPKSVMKVLWMLPAASVEQYALGDIITTRAVWEKQKPLVLTPDHQSAFELDCALIVPQVEMRRRGIRSDVKDAYSLKREIASRVESELKQMSIDFDSPLTGTENKAQVVAICDKLGITYDKTERGNPSITKDWLEANAEFHPFLHRLHEVRQAETLATSIIEQVVANTRYDTERMYPEMSIVGTSTGRFSCSKPNAGQISKRTKMGVEARRLFLPDNGQVLLCMDVSQQELRILAAIAATLGLPTAQDVVDVFNNDPKADYHAIVAAKTGLDRSKAKTINFALAYGAGADKIAWQLNRPVEETREILESYHRDLPYVKGLTDWCKSIIRSEGKIPTLMGRCLTYDFYEPNKPWSENGGLPWKALPKNQAYGKWGWDISPAYSWASVNHIVQGTAAEMFKRVLLDLHKQNIKPIFHLYDELLLSVPETEVDATIITVQAIIKNAMPELGIVFNSDARVGRSWKECSEK